MLPLLLPIHIATVAVAFNFFLTPTYDATISRFTLQIRLSPLFFFSLYKLLRHRDIQVSLRSTSLVLTPHAYAFSLVQFTSRKYVPFIQIVKIIIINATKTHVVTQCASRRYGAHGFAYGTRDGRRGS